MGKFLCIRNMKNNRISLFLAFFALFFLTSFQHVITRLYHACAAVHSTGVVNLSPGHRTEADKVARASRSVNSQGNLARYRRRVLVSRRIIPPQIEKGEGSTEEKYRAHARAVDYIKYISCIGSISAFHVKSRGGRFAKSSKGRTILRDHKIVTPSNYVGIISAAYPLGKSRDPFNVSAPGRCLKFLITS